jgi:4-amino-4-deoxy-L-arabinose transferase-like glycosyltransferase
MSDARGGSRTFWLVALALLVTLPGAVNRELMPPDEPRFALVGLEMAQTGDAIVLSRGHELYTDKPPLLFWGQALLFEAFGKSELAARVPSLLAALVLIGTLHLIARRWLGEPVATRATLVLVSCNLFIQRGPWVATDPLLTAAVLAGIALTSVAAESGSRWIAAAAGACLGLGVLAKGPVALLFVALAWAASLLTRARAFTPRPLARWPAIAAFLVVALPWPLLWVHRLGADTVVETIWHHNVERFVDSWDNIKPWWYQGRELLIGLFPWSLFAWTLLVPRVAKRWWTEPRVRWLAALFGLTVLFFSIPEGKREVYVFPAYFAAAIVVAVGLGRVLEERAVRRAGAVAVGALASLAGVLALATAFVGHPPLPEDLAAAGSVRAGAAVLLGLIAAACGASAWWLWRGDARVFYAPVILAAGYGLLSLPVLTPALNEGQGARAFAAELERIVPPSAELAYTKKKWELIAWYSGDHGPWLRTPDEVADYLREPGLRVVVGVVEELGEPSSWPEGTRVIGRPVLGRREYAVLARGGVEPTSDRLSLAP